MHARSTLSAGVLIIVGELSPLYASLPEFSLKVCSPLNSGDLSSMFVVLGLRCLLDCHVLKGFGIYMIGILDRLY